MNSNFVTRTKIWSFMQHSLDQNQITSCSTVGSKNTKFNKNSFIYQEVLSYVRQKHYTTCLQPRVKHNLHNICKTQLYSAVLQYILCYIICVGSSSLSKSVKVVSKLSYSDCHWWKGLSSICRYSGTACCTGCTSLVWKMLQLTQRTNEFRNKVHYILIILALFRHCKTGFIRAKQELHLEYWWNKSL